MAGRSDLRYGGYAIAWELRDDGLCLELGVKSLSAGEKVAQNVWLCIHVLVEFVYSGEESIRLPKLF